VSIPGELADGMPQTEEAKEKLSKAHAEVQACLGGDSAEADRSAGANVSLEILTPIDSRVRLTL
jgi:hypothetical protein